MLRLVFHGAACCGIKHIYGFNAMPNETHYFARQLKSGISYYSKTRNHDQCGGTNVHPEFSFFTDKAPQETYADRLKRLIDFCDVHRPQGIIEVVLCDESEFLWDKNTRTFTSQVDAWKGELKKHGFKEVSNCHNSNSGNRIHVFHRCKDKE